jgi:cytochrome P450
MPQQLPTDPIAAVVQPDPYPYYAHLRLQRPLYFDEGLGLWVAASSAAVEAALAHPGLRVRPPAEPVPKALAGTPAGEVFALLVRMNDGDFHRQHRPEVERNVARFRRADVAAAAAGAALDLAGDVDANTLLGSIPVRAIARLLGVPDTQLQATTWWVMDFVNGIAPQAAPEAIALASEAARELMAQGEAQGLDQARCANRIALMQQSLDATAGLIGNTARRVLEHPDDVGAGGLDAWRRVAAEVARWDAPVQNTRRWAASDVQLEGEAVAKGQCVLVLLASANRDEALNADPDRFDPQRPLARSLGFGAGPHGCPGEAIAIELAAAALRALDEAGHLERLFNRSSGFRPLFNARIPVFETQEQLQPLNPL